mgnify:CR=1 FL=1
MHSQVSVDSPPIAREKRTIRAMVEIFCRGHHAPRERGPSGEDLCPECRELLDYAWRRLDRCPFAPRKPTCARCPIHCYKPGMRERIRAVMRYAGPRMLLRHPILAVLHQLQRLTRPRPSVAPRRKAVRGGRE